MSRKDKQCCRERCFLLALPLLQSHYFQLVERSLHFPTVSVCLVPCDCLSVSLSNRALDLCQTSTKRKYLCISTFFFFPSKPNKNRGLELGGVCLPHVEACWTKTNMFFIKEGVLLSVSLFLDFSTTVWDTPPKSKVQIQGPKYTILNVMQFGWVAQ